MISTSEIENDMRVALGLAQLYAPQDTGNLRFNAIKAEMTNDGFRIKYSLQDAYYIYFLEEGTRKSTKHVGFIANETYPIIASYLHAKYQKQNQPLVKEFIYASLIGSQDFLGDSKARMDRLNFSQNIDITALSVKNRWEHNPNIERYDSGFMGRRAMLWSKKNLGQVLKVS